MHIRICAFPGEAAHGLKVKQVGIIISGRGLNYLTKTLLAELDGCEIRTIDHKPVEDDTHSKGNVEIVLTELKDLNETESNERLRQLIGYIEIRWKTASRC